jgi:hypothetical protein
VSVLVRPIVGIRIAIINIIARFINMIYIADVRGNICVIDWRETAAMAMIFVWSCILVRRVASSIISYTWTASADPCYCMCISLGYP